jgi:hypothetical protein
MQRRGRLKEIEQFEQSLLKEAERMYEEALLLPPGPAREVALRKARQTRTRAHLSDWLRSPGLKPPT